MHDQKRRVKNMKNYIEECLRCSDDKRSGEKINGFFYSKLPFPVGKKIINRIEDIIKKLDFVEYLLVKKVMMC